MNRQTPRPSQVFLDGMKVEDLYHSDEDDEGGGNIENSGHTQSSGSVNEAVMNNAAARRLSLEERRALQKLNSDRNSFLEIVNIMMMNSLSAAVQNEGLHALSLVHDPEVKMLKECAQSCGLEVIVNAMGKCSKVRA